MWETLFLVDHQKPEIAEADRLGEQRVGADDDIDLARGQPLARPRGVGLPDKARQRPHGERKAAKAFGEALKMLAREQRRRRDHRHLIARHRGDKGGAHRHLRLAKADIAADQPVHRPPRGEIGQNILDRALLVLGLLPGKARGKRLPGVMFGLEHRRAAQLALGRHPDEPFGHLADALLEAGLARLPRPPAEAVEKPLFLAITAEQFDVLNRQVKP